LQNVTGNFQKWFKLLLNWKCGVCMPKYGAYKPRKYQNQAPRGP
jgi:hypothetical protein